MFDSFGSTQDFIDLYGDGVKSDMRRRICASKAIKDNLAPPADQSGLQKLISMTSLHTDESRAIETFLSVNTLVDALALIANKAINEGASGPFHQVIEAFIGDIGLTSKSAKNTTSNKLSDDFIPEKDLSTSGQPCDHYGNNSKSVYPESTQARITSQPNQAVKYHNDISRKQRSDKPSPKNERNVAPHEAVSPHLVSSKDTVVSGDFNPLDDYEGTALNRRWQSSGQSAEERILNGELMKLPGILPPPPAGGTGEQYQSWLEGEVSHYLNFSIKIRLDEEDNDDDLTEMLSEFHSMPDGACQTYGARDQLDPHLGDDAFMRLFYAGRYLGFQRYTLNDAADELSRSVMKYFEEFEPRSAEFLNRAGCDIKCDPRLAAVLSHALDVEDFFITHGPEGAEQGSSHDIRGSISSDNRLNVPHVLDRAIFNYFTSGIPISETIIMSLNELRHAQLCRHLGQNVSTVEFDAQYQNDWFLELDEFEMSSDNAFEPS